jgi:hypothetical protein
MKEMSRVRHNHNIASTAANLKCTMTLAMHDPPSITVALSHCALNRKISDRTIAEVSSCVCSTKNTAMNSTTAFDERVNIFSAVKLNNKSASLSLSFSPRAEKNIERSGMGRDKIDCNHNAQCWEMQK